MNAPASRSPDALLESAAPAPERGSVERLRRRLLAGARREGLVDVAYATVDSPFGPLLLAATDEGLVRVAFAREDHARVLATLASRVSPRVLRDPDRMRDVARQVEEYFAGRRRAFDLRVDLRLASGFRRDVLRRLREIPYGGRSSYSALAADVGRPAAVRAVGTACATNPLPIVVPCHRVVRRDGSVGEYLGGTSAKRALLALEGALPDPLPA
jgi:methylated-DNA-[protein]-cysteine S-methyltransferase